MSTRTLDLVATVGATNRRNFGIDRIGHSVFAHARATSTR